MNRDILRILNLEADGGVHESIRRHAAATGLALVFERAASRGEFEAALRRGGVDLILASHTVPGFGGTEALESAREIAPGVPYVIVSDSIGEDRAAECLRRGAVDFVHKDRLERLPAAIERATRDAPQRGPRMEADLLHAQKMELVGRLAGGFAHEFNNLLTIISGYVSMLLDRDSLPPEPSEALQRVFTASRRAAGLVNQLLLFSRKRAPRREAIDLNAEVEQMVAMVRRLLGEAVGVAFEPSPDSPRIRADVGMLEQLLVILAINARDAMPRGGRLSVSIGSRPGDGAGPAARGGDYACLAVADTGCGIPAAILPRIFEPLFTTKEEGRGTGLGLATAQDVVKRHGGWIEVESEVGAGSVFRIFLPVTRDEIDPLPEARAGSAPSEGKATILLVEDEAAVREFAAAVLLQDGHSVLQAHSGDKAIEVWRWHSARIDLLLTDVALPGDFSGPQLGAMLLDLKPELRVIFVTGYARETVEAASVGGPPPLVLSKPFTPRSLLRAVREAMA